MALDINPSYSKVAFYTLYHDEKNKDLSEIDIKMKKKEG